MSDQRKFKPLPRTILDFGKTKLFAEKLEGGERRPSFGLMVIRGFVHPMVRTGLPTDIKGGVISAKMNLRTWYVFIHLFKMVLDKEKSSVRVNLHAKKYNQEEKRYDNELVPTGAVKVARDKDEKIYISLVVDDRPKIQFYFGQEYDVSIKTEGGNELTEAEYSQLDAQGYWMMLQDLVPMALKQSAKSIFESPFEDEGSSKGNAPSSINTPTQSFDDFDDDIPF